MRKGRHRRFEEARALKRLDKPDEEPCAECGADPEDDHASWCLAPVEDLLDEQEAAEKWTSVLGSNGPSAGSNGSAVPEADSQSARGVAASETAASEAPG